MVYHHFYLVTIIPVIASCGKLRHSHKYYDSNLKSSTSSLFSNLGGYDRLKTESVSPLPKTEESHEMLEPKTNSLFDMQYRTTTPPKSSFDNSFMSNLGLSLGLEAYPTLQYFPSSMTNYHSTLKRYISNFYDSIFNVLNNLEDQISRNGSSDIFHFSDAYF